jgi:hypothetical protein
VSSDSKPAAWRRISSEQSDFEREDYVPKAEGIRLEMQNIGQENGDSLTTSIGAAYFEMFALDTKTFESAVVQIWLRNAKVLEFSAHG